MWRIIKKEGKGYQIINDDPNHPEINWVFPEELKRYGLKTLEEELDEFGK